MRIALALCVVTLLPGVPLATLFARQVREAAWFLSVATALGLLWTTLGSLGAAALHLSFHPFVLTILFSLPLLAVLGRSSYRQRFFQTLRALNAQPVTTALVALTAVLLSIPLLTVKQGLPTGDVQKAIFWAEQIRTTHALPDYRAALDWNRDPIDFAIPGLHTLTAAVSSLAGEPLHSIAWLSLCAGIALAGVTGGIARMLTAERPLIASLAFLFVATNMRFLRFTVAPGYHYQNLVGELFFVSAVFFVLLAVSGRGTQRPILAAAVSLLLLPLVHQFTAFLALFIVPLVLGALLLRYRGEIAILSGRLSQTTRHALRLLAGAAATSVALFLLLGPVREKLPHLFTATPHLRPLVISPLLFPALLGPAFTLLAGVGAVSALQKIRAREIDWRWSLILFWTLIVFFLSQGARAVIDIPSARTAFYLVIPFALLAALAVGIAIDRIEAWWPRARSIVVPTALALTLAPTAGASLNTSVQTIDHSLQTNATLTPAILELVEFLNANPPICGGDRGQRTGDRTPSPSTLHPSPCGNAILIDDWNRRRLTWTILTPYRMLTRVGADLSVIAREAHQSEQRNTQYETLLDFEKIFSLGNRQEVLSLLHQYGIAYIAAASGLSADVFSANAQLPVAFRNAEVTLYHVPRTPTDIGSIPDIKERAFLLDRATVANDVGDGEDVFAHLPLALLAPQISQPTQTNGVTIRDVQSAVSAISINVGAYLPERWDTNGDQIVDRPVALLLRVIGNGARGRITRGTTVFEQFTLPSDGGLETIRTTIPAGELPIDEQGLVFVTVRLDQGPLRVDLVAAGTTLLP